MYLFESQPEKHSEKNNDKISTEQKLNLKSLTEYHCHKEIIF